MMSDIKILLIAHLAPICILAYLFTFLYNLRFAHFLCNWFTLVSAFWFVETHSVDGAGWRADQFARFLGVFLGQAFVIADLAPIGHLANLFTFLLISVHISALFNFTYFAFFRAFWFVETFIVDEAPINNDRVWTNANQFALWVYIWIFGQIG